MRYICTADIHARSNKPALRNDTNFLDTVKNKLHQIVTLTNINDAHLLIAGDLFHSATISYEVFNAVHRLLNDVINDVYIVAGQHDLKNHNPDIGLSPLYTLHDTRDDIYVMEDHQWKDVHGVQWGLKIKPSTLFDPFILLTHKGVTPEKPPHFLESSISAKKMLKKHSDYKYIVTGDYHVSFCMSVNEKSGLSRYLINPGSMIRSNIDQIDHKPCVYLLDTDTNTVQQIYLKVAPVEEVFDLTKAVTYKDTKEFQSELKDFIESLKMKAESASFKKTLKMIMKKSGTSKEVKQYIKGIMNGC